MEFVIPLEIYFLILDTFGAFLAGISVGYYINLREKKKEQEEELVLQNNTLQKTSTNPEVPSPAKEDSVPSLPKTNQEQESPVNKDIPVPEPPKFVQQQSTVKDEKGNVILMWCKKCYRKVPVYNLVDEQAISSAGKPYMRKSYTCAVCGRREFQLVGLIKSKAENINEVLGR